MFFCAAARPVYDSDGECVFDGKLEIWPFTEMVTAQRNLRNRPAGTFEMKNINVTRAIYKKFIREKVIPAIMSKWPGRRPIRVRMQQDNAKVHVSCIC